MAQLATRGVGYSIDEEGDRAPRGEARRKPFLEAVAGRHRHQCRADEAGRVDERDQLGRDGGLASGQESIDGLVKALGRRAGWQEGLLVEIGIGSGRTAPS